MREQIYKILESDSRDIRRSSWYNIFMIFVILCSFVPLMFKKVTPVLALMDVGTAAIFAVDYILRWMTADLKFGKKGIGSFLRYPFTPLAIVDLLSIMPIILAISPAFKLFRFTRLILALRILRVFRLFRYSKNLRIIANVFQKQKHAFLMVLLLMLGYVFISAAILFQIEPDTFDNFFDAVYWAVILLTTVGYGDILAATVMGKIITILSALMGIAVVALPAGLIIAGYLDEIQKDREDSGEGAEPANPEAEDAEPANPAPAGADAADAETEER